MLLGIDIGGTFTDGFYIDEHGRKTEVKVLSTPQDNFVGGFLSCIEEIARSTEQGPAQLLHGVRRFTHGSTIATNTVIEDTGAKVGMITTRGHRDVLKGMLGSGRITGRPIDDVYNFLLPRPEPIITDDLIVEVSERSDHKGATLVKLNRKETEEAVHSLLDKGIETLAVCFLWSFLNPEHEHQVKEIAQSIKPDLFVSCSSDVVPMHGEYQRFTATALNSIVQPRSARYVDTVQEELRHRHDFAKPIYIMGSDKGIRSWSELRDIPVYMIDSGPVGGLCAAEQICSQTEERNAIAVDMGGTSFDIGIIVDGSSLMKDHGVAKQWEYAIARSDIESIGAGGGSIAWFDETTETVRVGPQSAGSHPGPACYGLGGTAPTVSDANLILGYLSPWIQIAGKKLDKEKALQAVGALGERIGRDPEGMALGIFDLVNELMGGRVRSEMIARGLDYRQFVLICYGGAGPLHMSDMARVIGLRRCIVPANASVLSASGLCAADFKVGASKEVAYTEPWDAASLNADFAELEAQAIPRIKATGGTDTEIAVERSLAMQFKGQFYRLAVPTPGGELNGNELAQIKRTFVDTYTARYGEASALPGAAVNILSVRADCIGKTVKPKTPGVARTTEIPPSATATPRRIYDKDAGGFVQAKVYNGVALLPGNAIAGPAMIDFPHTSIRLRLGDTAVLDEAGNVIVAIGG